MKTINALFLDELSSEFNSHKRNKRYLKQMLKKIAKMKLLDPACGCGNFLIIAYRELRRLEIKIYKQILTPEQQVLIQSFNRGINVDSMYGFETLEFPVRIAEVALWLVDHQINNELSIAFGCDYRRLPLTKSPTILQRNALRINWEDILPKDELTYILGNPPFVGKKRRNDEQIEDMDLIWHGVRNHGILDYVTCWYAKATEYISGTGIKVAFVSTNSITQGEQVGVLWDYLLNEKEIKIHFAHRTFRWFNKARGKANVFVVIIGFASFDTENKFIFDYDTPDADPSEIKVKNINPYLINQKDIIIKNRSKPISDVSKITFGSMPNDGGNFLFTDLEKEAFLSKEPDAKKFILPFISAREFLSNKKRWCLWLKDSNPSEINRLPKVVERIRKVKEYRLKSDRDTTVRLADTPYLFGEIRQPDEGSYILIPRHSAEHRKYIPIDILSKDNIAGDSCCIIKNASKYQFGVLTSTMHMAWVRQICGRIKGDYRYSNKLVYNNFPWPKNPSEKKIKDVEKWVKELLNARKEFGGSSLSDLYNPYTMPQKLLKIHKKLDRAVDRCYRSPAFRTDLERLNFLFELYDQYLQKDKKLTDVYPPSSM